MKRCRQAEWDDAQRRCKLTDEAVAMAKQLGIGPRSLIKNIPSPNQRWKAPVEDWVRDLHAKRFRTTTPGPRPELRAPAPEPSPVNKLEAAREALEAYMRDDPADTDAVAEAMDALERDVPVSEGEVADENRFLLLRRDVFRRFAEIFAEVAARLEIVDRIVLFGSVAAPPKKEIPRFARLRHAGVAVWHECKDVDLAIWVTDLSRLRELKRAVNDAINRWQPAAVSESLPGVASHQVDIFLFEPRSDRYRGNLCHFSQCPKRKPECEVAGCGAQPFLRLYEDFHFDRAAPFAPGAITLFQRRDGPFGTRGTPEQPFHSSDDIPF